MLTVVLLFVAGAALLIAGVWSTIDRRKFLKSGVRVQGVITEITSKGEESFEAEIVFETECHEVVFVTQYLMGNRWSYKVGQSVDIIYNPLCARKFIWDEGPYKPSGSSALYAGAVCLMIAIAGLMTVLR